MNIRTTWTLVTLAAGVFALIWFVERPLRIRASAPVSRQIFSGLDPARVNEIKVLANQVEVRLDKTNNVWQITSPIRFRADPNRVYSLLVTLSNLQWMAFITPEELQGQPTAQKDFGFDSPQYTFQITEGERSYYWKIGHRTAPGDQTFLQVVGGTGVYLVDARLIDVVPRQLDDWRDRALVPFTGIPVDQLLVTAGGVPTRGFKLAFDRTNALWKLVLPQLWRADNAKINTLLVNLAQAEISRFVSETPRSDNDLEALGLRPPELAIEFMQTSNLVAGLLVGNSPATNSTLVYVQHKGRPEIFLAPAAAVSAWRAAPSDFRERHLVNPPSEGIGAIEIQGEDSFTVRRLNDRTWMVAEPHNFPADPVLMTNLLTGLTTNLVEFEKGVVTDRASYGLAKPVVQYRVFSATTNQDAGRLLGVIDFGVTNATGPVFVRRSDTDETSVDRIKREDFNRLPLASWQLRDRLIWDFASSNVVAVTVRQKGYTQKLIRNVTGDWIIATNMQGFVNSFALEETLHRMGELRAYWWTGRGQEPDDRYGFKEINHQVQIDVKKDGRMESLVIDFGKASPESLHPYASVVLGGVRMVFEFPLTLYYELVREHLSIIKASLPVGAK
ncbi:MAG: DUF4340 domain-containing protein [Opitutaceae bacterium]|nr:DUF4340 domain-containing protein [Verrucomicrobiales bacterium]